MDRWTRQVNVAPSESTQSLAGGRHTINNCNIMKWHHRRAVWFACIPLALRAVGITQAPAGRAASWWGLGPAPQPQGLGFIGPRGTHENTWSLFPPQLPWGQGCRAGAWTPVPRQLGQIPSSEPRQATSQSESSLGSSPSQACSQGLINQTLGHFANWKQSPPAS